MAAAGVAGKRASKSRTNMRATGTGINGFSRIGLGGKHRHWSIDLRAWWPREEADVALNMVPADGTFTTAMPGATTKLERSRARLVSILG